MKIRDDIRVEGKGNTIRYKIWRASEYFIISNKGANRILAELLYIETAMSYMSCDMGAIDGLEKIRLND